MFKSIKSLKCRIKRWVKKQSFYPDILGVFINPTYLSCHGLDKSISSLFHHIEGKILDIGCGSKPYLPLLKKMTEYIGMEYDTPKNRLREEVDIFYDGKHFPFPNAYFDSAIATEVLEHVFNPDEFLHETNRVLKRGGFLLLTCPFMWMEHQQPYDYGRYSSFGIAHILKKHGFEILSQEKTVCGLSTIFQLLAGYMRTKITVKNYYVHIFLYILLISPLTIIGIILSWLSSQESPIYITNVILAKKI